MRCARSGREPAPRGLTMDRHRGTQRLDAPNSPLQPTGAGRVRNRGTTSSLAPPAERHGQSACKRQKMNRWNIPDWLERTVIARDRHCIYCGVAFDLPNPSRGMRPSWEHIINDAKIVTLENIARCCTSCNASKGSKLLADWLQSDYCKRKSISERNISEVAAAALRSSRDKAYAAG